MPGWHERTRPWVEQGRLQVIGVLEEQHPDRALLFRQWKQLADFPLLADPLNLLDVAAVPITLFVEADGTIAARNPRPEDLEGFLEAAPVEAAVGTAPGPAREDALASLLRRGHWAEAVGLARDRVAGDDGNGRAHFRLGCALRMRHDAGAGEEEDFAAAIRHWRRALSLDPNQYTWRRRIQQYGPRLDKPYAFYDWVPEARREVAARGETPHPLAVEPTGAEFARPAGPETGADDGSGLASPDPDGRVQRDSIGAIAWRSVAVPSTDRDQAGVYRFHLTLQLSGEAWSWNNEADPLGVWLEPGESGWTVANRSLQADPGSGAASREPRILEFEARWRGAGDPPVLRGHALYHLCEEESGLCTYRRLDLALPVGAGR